MVFACTQANSFGVIDCVGAVLPVDTRKEIGGIIRSCHFLLVDDVNTSLVEGYRVGGGEDTVIFELDGGGMVDAVAVDAHIVHHTDEDDALLLLEIVDHALCGGCHTLEEAVLVAYELGSP